MILQIINLSLPEVLNKYKTEYDIPEIRYTTGLLAIELREIEPGQVNTAGNHHTDSIFVSGEKNKGLKLLILGSLQEIERYGLEIIDGVLLKEKFESFISNYKSYFNTHYTIKNKRFSLNQLLVMGIVNITPDSFSDGGKYFNHEAAFKHAEELIIQGADIIDIGGESSRPGSDFISTESEMERIIPVINKLKKKYPDVLISADTTKGEVAAAALENGADIINDISGGTFDKSIFRIVHDFDAAIILMHIKGIPKSMQKDVSYDNLINEVYDFLWNQSQMAKDHGIKDIIIDPGIGFGKNMSHNLQLIKRISDFISLGFPILIGNSRKSFLGKISELEVTERDIISVIADTYAVNAGARIIRTHNVKYGVQLRQFFKAVEYYHV